MTLMPVSEAQERLLNQVRPLAVQAVPLDQALGRYLVEPMRAKRTQPAADLSAMDGYAIRYGDVPGPWTIVGESRAGGENAQSIGAGQACRISTGAALPSGADTILIRENATVEAERLVLVGDPPGRCGQFVRKAGQDFAQGDALADSGAPVTPAMLGLAVMSGHETLVVRHRPKIALIATGDEIANGTLPDANTPMLAAICVGSGADVRYKAAVGDDLGAIAAAIERASDCDLVITSGGVSVGDHDHVRAALESVGGSVDFWRIAMRPGKPLLAGKIGKAVLLGLPGNPVSCFVTAHLFALPLLRALAGATDPIGHSRSTKLAVPLAANGERETYLRGYCDGETVMSLEDQDSAAMLSLSRANVLIRREIGAGAADIGYRVAVLPIDRA